MKTKEVIRYFFLGFLNPSLFGVYVLIAAISGVIFITCYFGYGCWFRVGGLVFMFFVPIIFVLLLAVILAGRLQTMIWRRLLKQPETNSNQMPLGELFFRACFVTLFIPIWCADLGNKFPEARAQKVCADCAPLIADLGKYKQLKGIYPTNAVDLVKSNAALRRRYFFYYGQPSTNGIDWTADKVAEAHVSLFVTTNSFQCIVPIEKMSPVSFSSFYVYSCNSEHLTWNKVLLHWSYGSAYVDEPSH